MKDMKKTFLFLAEGFEEVEAVATVDVLRRGGVELQTVAVGGERQVKGAHGVPVIADLALDELVAEEAECLIFPGGMPGAQNLADHRALLELMQRHYDAGRCVAAICAAPALVLGRLRPGRRLRVTCYPGFEDSLPADFEVSTDGVVVDGNVITGKGPGFAVKFGLTILKHLRSEEVAKEVAAGMLL